MKRKSILIVLSVILMTVAIGLTACGKKHTHTYDKQVAEAEYLATSATCTQKATYYYSCECGQRGTETFKYGIPLGHNFTNYVSDNNATCTEDGTKTAKCDRCDETDTITDENSALGHSFTNYVPDGNATHAQDGTKTARCDREGCSATDTVIDEGSHNGHTYSSEWTTDENYHWHIATCEHKDKIDGKSMHTASDWIIDVEATYEHAGQRHKECTVCKRILQQEKIDQLVKDGIAFRTLETSGKTVYGSVRNAASEFNFKEEIIVGKNTTYYVSLDQYGSNLILTKIAPLSVGNNKFYILTSVNGEIVDAFVVTIRRKPIYTITFNSNGGTFVNKQQIEEGFFVEKPPVPEKTGYTFTGWDYDFTKAITTNVRAKASWSANTDTKYKVEYYLQNLENDDYTLYETVILQGTTDTTAFAEQKTYEHFTFNGNGGVLNGNIDGDGSLVLKVYYTRDIYTLSNENTKYGEITNATSVKYGTLVRTEIIEYLGCELIGWYDGEELLSTDKNYTFNIDKDVTAKFKIKDEMSNFTFACSKTSCKITGVKDKTVMQIIIPDYVTEIGGYDAFYNCTGLTSLTIGNSVTSIEGDTFYNCTGLTRVEWNAENCTYAGSGSYPIFRGCTNLTTVIIGDNVKTIPSYAFNNTAWYNNQPDGLVYAGKVAYKYKGTMPYNTTIVIKEGTIAIGGGAFRDCSRLTSITIPDSVTSIGNSAFYDCRGLASITIPDSVTSIENSAFEGCGKLTNIHIRSIESWCKISGLDNLMKYGANNKKLYINGEEITEFIIPDGITSIGDYAFYNCSGLTSVTIPDSVTSIGAAAFKGCSGLTSITIPFVGASREANNGYDQVFGYIFGYTTSSSFSGTTYQYSSNSTYYYFIPSSLRTVIIGNEVTKIPYHAFYNCSGLTSITIGNSVTSIGDYAFCWCSGLTSITIPGSVTSIGEDAFYGCTRLTSITYKGTIAEWGKITKGNDWKYKVPSSCVIHCTDGDIKISDSD